MSRWRDIKQGNIKEEETSKTPEDNSLTSAPIPSRI